MGGFIRYYVYIRLIILVIKDKKNQILIIQIFFQLTEVER